MERGGSEIFPVCPEVDSMCWMWNYRNIFIIGRWKSFKVHFALIFFLVLRHIALLVASLVVARNWSLGWAWSFEELQVHFHAQRGHEIRNNFFICGTARHIARLHWSWYRIKTLPGERHWLWYRIAHCQVKYTGCGTVWHITRWNTLVVVPYDTLSGEIHWLWYRMTYC